MKYIKKQLLFRLFIFILIICLFILIYLLINNLDIFNEFISYLGKLENRVDRSNQPFNQGYLL